MSENFNGIFAAVASVLKADLIDICLESIKVSSAIDVNIPLIIAKDIINITGHSISINWKYAIVPKSPIQQPSRHHNVFLDDCNQVCWQYQLICKIS